MSEAQNGGNVMERLTQRLRTGEVLMASEYEEKYTEQEWISVLQDRLAAYEDTHMMPSDVTSMRMDMAIIAALFNGIDVDRMKELAEADRAGRLVVLPFTSGRTLLCKENIDSPRLMKDVELAIRYCSSCGIVFHMGYNVFCDLVKHGRITAVSEEAEKALEAMKNE